MRELLSRLAQPVVEVAELPRVLVQACVEVLPVSGVGLVLVGGGRPAGVLATAGGSTAAVEELQFSLGEGPGVEAATTGRLVLQPHLARSGPQRWPGFAAGALDAGIGAVFAFPLRVGGIRVAVLDLYRGHAGPLSGADLADALRVGEVATTMVLRLQAKAPLDDEGVAALVVLDDRAVVHQATGMVSVQAGVDLAEAMLLLRARSFSLARPVTHVAEDVLARRLRFGDDRAAETHGRFEEE